MAHWGRYTYNPAAEEGEANTPLSTNQKLVIAAEAGNLTVLQSLMLEPGADVNYRSHPPLLCTSSSLLSLQVLEGP